ncbi:MAG: hypothetical protein K6L80_10385 [Agarilytica sp.]
MKILAIILFAALASSAIAEKTKHAHTHKYQKPGAPIRLLEPDFVQIDPNSNRRISVQFETPSKGQLSVITKPGDGLSINENKENTFDLSTDTPELELDIVTGDVGQYHVMFHATVSEQGFTSTRVFGFAVQVGEPVAAKAQKSSSPFVIMKAEETIR